MVRKRLRDLFLYVAIALVIVAFAMTYAIFAARAGRTGDEALPWIWTIASAAIVFGYLAYLERRLARRMMFWAVVLLMLVGHFIGFLGLFSKLKTVPLLWITFAIGPELIAFDLVLQLIFRRQQRACRLQLGGGRGTDAGPKRE